MNFSELQSYVLLGLAENSTNPYFTTAQLKTAINESYKTICMDKKLRLSLKETTLYIPVTTLTADVSSGASVLPLTSANYFGKNRDICLTDGSNFEYHTISSISALNATLSEAIENDFDSDNTYVILDIHYLPYDCGKLVSARIWNNEETTLTIHDRTVADAAYPKRESIKDYPDELYMAGVSFISDGQITSVATTNTTQVSANDGGNSMADYYNGWMLVNETHAGFSRISDYTQGTPDIFYLKEAITSQTTGDKFHIEPQLKKFFVYPHPNDSFYLHLVYRAIPDSLVNDYDIPHILPEEYHKIIVHLTCRDLSIFDPNNINSSRQATIHDNFYKGMYKKLYDYTNQEEGELESFGRRESVTNEGAYNPGIWDRIPED